MKDLSTYHPVSPYYEHYDFGAGTGFQGRLFICGDIHGRFSLLEEKLAENGFRKGIDWLFSVGDLADRGPESHLVEPWMDGESPAGKMPRTLGNHEMLGFISGMMPEHGFHFHLINGGKWFTEIPEIETRVRIARKMIEAPALIEITTPAGRKIGIAHAAVPGNNWQKLKEMLIRGNTFRAKQKESPNIRIEDDLDHRTIEEIYEDRKDIEALLRGEHVPMVSGIDHVFFGHTIIKDGPLIYKNRSYIDTGANKYGKITLLEIDSWLDFISHIPEERREEAGGILLNPQPATA